MFFNVLLSKKTVVSHRSKIQKNIFRTFETWVTVFSLFSNFEAFFSDEIKKNNYGNLIKILKTLIFNCFFFFSTINAVFDFFFLKHYTKY